MIPVKRCITITFGDMAENHVGMEKIGELRPDLGRQVTPEWLSNIANQIPNSELIEIASPYIPGIFFERACILVLRKCIGDADNIYNELLPLNWDTKAKMRGKVVNKKARYNLCFSSQARDPDYENGKGRIISLNSVPRLDVLRKSVGDIMGNHCTIQAEGNYYHDISSCYIGFHGDTERSFVIGARFGENFPLHYQWYYGSNAISPVQSIMLGHGDMYIMSNKAVGSDWKKKLIPTLRHAAGYKLG